MIANIDPIKSAIASIISAFAGSFSKYLVFSSPFIYNIDTAFQRVAWTVAILAGLVSAWNGLMTTITRYKKNHPKKAEE